MNTEKAQTYAERETVLNRLAQIIVNVGCKPYAAAEAILAAGWREHPELSDALHTADLDRPGGESDG